MAENIAVTLVPQWEDLKLRGFKVHVCKTQLPVGKGLLQAILPPNATTKDISEAVEDRLMPSKVVINQQMDRLQAELAAHQNVEYDQ